MESEKYFWMIISALIGAVSGIFATFWRTRYSIKAQDFSKRVEELCASIGKLEELCCTYWNGPTDPTKANISKSYILGVKTKVSILINYLDDEYSDFYTDTISTMLNIFFKACTGGDFETSSPRVDSERQREILITGEKLKIEIMKTRNKLY